MQGGDVIFIVSLIFVMMLIAVAVTIVFTVRWVQRQREEIHRQFAGVAELEQNVNMNKTRVLTSLSHDIRTPMNAITGMVAIAERHLDDPQYIKACLNKITLASDHLLRTMNDALDITKAESGRMVLQAEKFCLADTVMNLVNIVCPQITAKGLSFRARTHHITHEYLYADELRLSQIYINILTNAVKFTPSGGSVFVDLTEEPVEGRPDMVRLTYVVEDTGIGMSPEFQETMYESLSHVGENHTGRQQDTGLGLPVTRQMIDLMDGTIECESAVDEGTKFTVKINILIARQEEREEAEHMLPPMKLLLADSDKAFLADAAEILRDLGAEVDCLSDEGEAIRRATGLMEMVTDAEKVVPRKDPGYRAVILDWEMRGRDGAEMVREMKARLDVDTPLFVSTYDRAEIKDIARAAGADGFLSKPLFRSTMYRQLNELLRFDREMLEPENESTEDLAGMHLLIAEDNNLNWEMVQELLDMYGISSDRAENGRLCVERLRKAGEGVYDAILMDIQMPEMNGLDAARAIHADEEEWVRTIPIIAMTADAFAEDIANCLEAGMDGHVAKPIDLKKLFWELRKARQK